MILIFLFLFVTSGICASDSVIQVPNLPRQQLPKKSRKRKARPEPIAEPMTLTPSRGARVVEVPNLPSQRASYKYVSASEEDNERTSPVPLNITAQSHGIIDAVEKIKASVATAKNMFAFAANNNKALCQAIVHLKQVIQQKDQRIAHLEQTNQDLQRQLYKQEYEL